MESLQTFLQNAPKHYSQKDLDFIGSAFEFAERVHKDQKRASGEPYFIHCYHVGLTVLHLGLDPDSVAAALLHDVIDDTPVTEKELEKKFNKDVAFLVYGVTKIGKIKYRGVERQIENIRKMLLAMAEDIRVIIIKIADRLHNMQTLSYIRPDKQKRVALETLEVYAPLAHRLGMGEFKGILEDLAFSYIHPQEYKWLRNNVKERYREREGYLQKVRPMIEENLTKEKIIPIQINFRPKHYYSLFKKLQKHSMNLDNIYDLSAVRIIVNSIEECYATLGVIHKLWKPIPGKIKDYVAFPKPNGYQSIHTTVFCLDGKITEFQIRTLKMHEEAEHGIVAHWAYSEQDKPEKGAVADKNKLEWVRQLKEWQNEGVGTEEFFDSLKIDFFKNRIFVFTPQGDVIDLPEGATAIDFAYQIHSEVGNHCFGAKVNNKMISLDSPLKNGDVVDVITKKAKKPSPAWLDFVKTNYAKSRIRQAARKEFGSNQALPVSSIMQPKQQQFEFQVQFEKDRVGIIKDISNLLSRQKINILKISSEAKNPPTVFVSCRIRSNSSPQKLSLKIKHVKNVADVSWKAI